MMPSMQLKAISRLSTGGIILEPDNWWMVDSHHSLSRTTHEFHETCHSVTFIVLVNSHQRWKQTWNRVCFHLWCELTLALWCHSIVWSLHEIICYEKTSFMEFMIILFTGGSMLPSLSCFWINDSLLDALEIPLKKTASFCFFCFVVLTNSCSVLHL